MEESLTTLKKSKAEMRDIVADGASVKVGALKGNLFWAVMDLYGVVTVQVSNCTGISRTIGYIYLALLSLA